LQCFKNASSISVNSSGPKHGFKYFFKNALRPKKCRQTLPNESRSTTDLQLATRPSIDKSPQMPEMAALHAHRLKYKTLHAQVATQLGERQDYTAIIHSLGTLDMNGMDGSAYERNDRRPPGEGNIASLPSKLWTEIVSYLNPAEAASLAIAIITLYRRLGLRYFMPLHHPTNLSYKLNFLSGLDQAFPHHLLCIPCATYHHCAQEGVGGLFDRCFNNSLSDEACFYNYIMVFGVLRLNWLNLLLGRLLEGVGV
jgi:hypothetical protein